MAAETLDDAFTMAEVGEIWVVPMLKGQPSKNLGTTFKKIIQRAGVQEWPRPFQNLRSSRQTELEQRFPTHVVCAWMGNTPRVAHKHYLTLTEDDFDAAERAKRGTSGGCNRVQSVAATRKTKLALSRKSRKTRVSLKLSASWKMPELRGQDSNLRPRGYEPREL
ncbi:MAG: hypothetical protein ABI614_09445, partial [Planctomycetota bacterium]